MKETSQKKWGGGMSKYKERNTEITEVPEKQEGEPEEEAIITI